MDKKIQKLIEEYERFAKKNGFSLNPNRVLVEGLAERLLENEKKYGKRYCPCRFITGDPERDRDKICPCKWHQKEIKETGHCHCNLFVK